MGSFFIGLLIGLVAGAVGYFYFSRKDSKKIKAEKAQIIYESEKAISEIEKHRGMVLEELAQAKKKIEELTVEEAKLRLSLDDKARIEASNEKVSIEASSDIMSQILEKALKVETII